MSEKRRKIYAIDFDGTIVEDKWPEIGEEKKETTDFIRAIQDLGCQWVLWTCRTDENLNEALEFCLHHGLYPNAVNEGVHPRTLTGEWEPAKVFADTYIDDKASGGLIIPSIPKSPFAHE